MLVNAKVVLMRCQHNKKLFGVRIQQQYNNAWDLTWAFPISEKRAQNEGFDKESLTVNIGYANTYPGCPYCATTGFVQCGSCGKFTCYNDSGEFTCAWCGNRSNSFKETDSFDLRIGED